MRVYDAGKIRAESDAGQNVFVRLQVYSYVEMLCYII